MDLNFLKIKAQIDVLILSATLYLILLWKKKMLNSMMSECTTAQKLKCIRFNLERFDSFFFLLSMFLWSVIGVSNPHRIFLVDDQLVCMNPILFDCLSFLIVVYRQSKGLNAICYRDIEHSSVRQGRFSANSCVLQITTCIFIFNLFNFIELQNTYCSYSWFTQAIRVFIVLLLQSINKLQVAIWMAHQRV